MKKGIFQISGEEFQFLEIKKGSEGDVWEIYQARKFDQFRNTEKAD